MMTFDELLAYNRNRRICQIGFTVPESELEKTLINWVEKMGAGPWKVFKRTFTEEGNGMWIALAMFGDMELEIVAPFGPWAADYAWLKDHLPGFSHFKEYCPSAERTKKEEEFEARGCKLAPMVKKKLNLDWPDEAWYVETAEYVSFRLELGNFAYLSEADLTKQDPDWYWFPAKG